MPWWVESRYRAHGRGAVVLSSTCWIHTHKHKHKHKHNNIILSAHTHTHTHTHTHDEIHVYRHEDVYVCTLPLLDWLPRNTVWSCTRLYSYRPSDQTSSHLTYNVIHVSNMYMYICTLHVQRVHVHAAKVSTNVMSSWIPNVNVLGQTTALRST